MGASDISWLNLFLGSLILLIPVAVLLYYKTGLTKAMLIAFGRMAVQLLLVGLYLMYIFKLNSLLVNFLWLLLMILAASLSIIKRSEIRISSFFVPVLMGVLADVIVNFLVFIFIISGTENFFNARYFIPLSGMIIGNCLSSGIIGIRSFYGSLSKNEERYKYSLMCGATRNEGCIQSDNRLDCNDRLNLASRNDDRTNTRWNKPDYFNQISNCNHHRYFCG